MTAIITGHNYSNNTTTSTVTVNSGGDVSIAGGGYSVIAGTGNNVSLSDSSGGVYAVTATNVAAGGTTPFGLATGIFLADSTAANVTGDGNAVTLGNNDTLGIIGGGNTINAGVAQALFANGELGLCYVSTGLPWEGTDDSWVYFTNDGHIYVADPSTNQINISNTHGVADILKVNGTQSGGGITLANNCQATLTGGANQINLGTGDTLTVVGGHNTISGGTGNTITVTGFENTISLSNSTSITINSATLSYKKNFVVGANNIITDNCASLAGLDITGNGNTVTATQVGAVLHISGDNTIATLSAASSSIYISGTGGRVTSTNNSINMTSAGTLKVIGNGNTISGVAGSNITNNLSNGTSKTYVWDASNVETITTYSGTNGTGSVTNVQVVQTIDAFATFTGSNAIIIAGGYNTINGNANTITAPVTSTMTINGINNLLTISAGYVSLGTSGKLTVTGDNNTFTGVAGSKIYQNTSDGHSQTFVWDAGGDEVITNFTGANGTGTATLYTVLDGQNVSLTAKNSTVNIGNMNTVTFTKTGNNVTLGAYNNDITSSNNTFTVAGVAGAWEHFHGNGNTINSSNETLTVSGSNNTINGSNGTITQTTGNSLKVNGDGNTIMGVAGATVTNNTSNGRSTVYHWNASNVETITTYLLPNGFGLILSIETIYTIADGQSKNISASNVTINMGNSSTANLTGSNNTVNAGQFDTINGSGNTINAATGDYINGNNNTINAQNDSLSINGSGNLITGTGNSIGLLSGTTLTVTGDGNSFSGVANATIINNHSNGTSTVYRWDASSNQTCTNYSGLGGTGSVTGMGVDPLILNLTGGSVDTQSLIGSPARFDMQNNGTAVQTGWASAGEGMLVYDPAHPNAPITQDAQLVGSFAALAKLDSNHDGQISVLDAAWSDLKVWVDSLGDAQYQDGSLYSLSQLDIASIDLHATSANRDSHGNTILADSTFTKSDGSTGHIAGVSLSQLVSSLATFAPEGVGQGSGGVENTNGRVEPLLTVES